MTTLMQPTNLAYEYQFPDPVEQEDKYYNHTSVAKAIYGTESETSTGTNKANPKGDCAARVTKIKEDKKGQSINFQDAFFWNEQYQKLLDEPTTHPETAIKKKQQLEELSSRFSTAARNVVVQLVEDISLSAEKKRHKPLDVGKLSVEFQ